MTQRFIGKWAALATLAAVSALSVAQTNPNVFTGDPASKSNTMMGCTYTATLKPNPTVSVRAQDCTALANALGAGNRYNATGGWAVNYKNLTGNIEVKRYAAWVDSYAGFTQGAHTVGATNLPKHGGAIFGVHYNKGAGDPADVNDHQANGNGNKNGNARWIQVVTTNCAPFHNTAAANFDAGGGFKSFIDDDGNTAGQGPFYDPIGLADAKDFIDIPTRNCGDNCNVDCTWKACLFLATETDAVMGVRQLNIYSTGIEWGFTFKCTPVPEPATMAALGLGTLAVARRRRKRS